MKQPNTMRHFERRTLINQLPRAADRRDFLAQKLALLDEVTKKAAESNQLNALIGASRLSAEMAQLV